MPSSSPVIEAMLSAWASQPEVRLDNVKFASDPEANVLIKEDLVAFLLAASIDRGGQSFAIWNIPWMLKREWGHLDTAIICKMSVEDLVVSPAIAKAPAIISRTDLARTLISVATAIEEQCGGNPQRLFDGNACEIITRLQRIYGIGPGIARMIVIQRLLYFGLTPVPGGRLLPKVDVMVTRVFQRAGLSEHGTDVEIELALRGLSALDIAVVDQISWQVGRDWCRPTEPICPSCSLTRVCPRVGV